MAGMLILPLVAGAARKNKQGAGDSGIDPSTMRVLYKHPGAGIPVLESSQLRHEGDVLLGYIVEVPVKRPSHPPPRLQAAGLCQPAINNESSTT